MKKLFVLSLCVLVVLYSSCKQKLTDDCGFCMLPDRANSISVKIPEKPVFKNGVFQVDLEIESDEESDAFIWMVLVHPELRDFEEWYHYYYSSGVNCDSNHPDYGYDVNIYAKGFGCDVKVDGFQIRTFNQVYRYQDDLCEYEKPTTKYPVFIKRIKLPENATIHEKIDIHLPDDFIECWGEIFIFRNSKAIEESMKTKLNPEKYNEFPCPHFNSYYKFFPDSSLFSYLMTDIYQLRENYVENSGYKDEIINDITFTLPRIGSSNVATIGEILIDIWDDDITYILRQELIPHKPAIWQSGLNGSCKVDYDSTFE